MRLRDQLNPVSGWRESGDVDKVRVYTRQSFLLIVVALGIAMIAQALQDHDVVTMAAAPVCVAAAFVVLQRTPALGGMSPRSVRIPLVLLLVSTVVIVTGGGLQNVLWAAMLVTAAVAARIAVRWSMAVAAGAVVLAVVLGATAVMAVLLGLFIVFMVATVRLSMWLLRIVTELDATRDAAAALSVAEERLRFSRDLHDVVGRALSAIAVKSELAATLARRGDDRAATQMDEVRALAQESMIDTRALVRGYRSVDVASELAGARSLLSAAGIRTELVGAVSDVPESAAEQAAWVVREGVTNILRHSSASFCRIEFDHNSIRIINDAPTSQHDVGDGTGLSGLRERLAATGGTLAAEVHSDTFVLAATFSRQEATS